MKYVKILGLLAVAAAAMMAFAASASATSITNTTGGAAATPTLHAVNEGGHVTLKNAFLTIQCSSTAEGTVESHGAGVPATGKLSILNFTGCTNSWHVTVIDTHVVEPKTETITHNGSLSVEWENGHNGILKSTGAKVDATRFGLTCVYETNNTTIGTVSGGSPATLKIEAAIPINGVLSGASCGTGTAAWSGSYETTAPLYVAP